MKWAPKLRPKFWLGWLVWHAVLLVFRRSTWAHYHLGNAYAYQGFTPHAERCYRAALEHQPAHAPALRNLATILFNAGRNEEALPILRAWREAEPGSADAALRLGLALERLDKAEEALAVYPSIASASERADVQERLARLCVRLRRWTEARTHATAWCRLGSDPAAGLAVLGQAHLGCGDKASARDCWERSLEKDPNQEKLKEMVRRLRPAAAAPAPDRSAG